MVLKLLLPGLELGLAEAFAPVLQRPGRSLLPHDEGKGRASADAQVA